MQHILRYFILPAVVAVTMWVLPLLVILPPILSLLCILGSVIPFGCLLDQRRLWKQKSDVRKIQLFGVPMALAAIPSCFSLAIFIISVIPEHPTISQATWYLFQAVAWTFGLVLIAYAGSAAWYKLAYK